MTTAGVVPAEAVRGRLILDDRVVDGRLSIRDGIIVGVDIDGPIDATATALDRGAPVLPYIAPGFVDVHVHGWGGHDAMGDPDALDGMARSLLRHGVTSFLPTAVTAPLEQLAAFAERVRAWTPIAPPDGAEPLGFNLEGPFLAEARHGAHDPSLLLDPATGSDEALAPLLGGLRLITVAPELPGALELIQRLRTSGTTVSLGHSAATYEEARLGYDAGATATTHLFNAMSGLDHRAPGLALAALLDDAAYVELIADRIHVDPALWALVTRMKPIDRLVLVSDAIALAGTGDGRGRIGQLDVDVRGSTVTLAGTTTLAGSVLALDLALRNVVAAGMVLPAAVAAVTRNPLSMLGIHDRGRLAVGQRADVVELDGDLRVRRVMRGGTWFDATAS